jgi:hypothetical protein
LNPSENNIFFANDTIRLAYMFFSAIETHQVILMVDASNSIPVGYRFDA